MTHDDFQNGLLHAHTELQDFLSGLSTPPQGLLEPENALQLAREIALWPPMAPDDWCGEFQPKPSP